MPWSRRSVDRSCAAWRSAATSLAEAERGSASLEFLTVGIVLLVPLVYLVLAVAAIQAGALGVEGAARHAARIAVLAADDEASDAAIDRAVRTTFADYGIDETTASVIVECDRADCHARGTRIVVTVRAQVQLPLVPDFLALTAAGSVPVEAKATQTVSRFAGSAP
ncbi:TadE family protein [Agromyces sp. Marseille-P2726]|uniref:TadE family protein n=1 Tax=Agromyces sp. Marseille-P2726 TaxID=2709132 RepID=UPI00156D850C|nr:TadE family protein [Agromyces sp. Marseille-P2726]